MFQRHIEEGFTMVSKISIIEGFTGSKDVYPRGYVSKDYRSKEVSKTVLYVLKTYIKEGSVRLKKVSNRIL